ncbi:hypothetical protein SAMD00019534_011410 [Acytostelium subglobosum LB1]|uniref:hypothetical protein n=1 Tax=Acytostelium subglobosum LB1 TaxID=1410327 RepID=UPI000644E079|nr:hypothetical protein SAMD00019534_011410 [Acytostelium subglobosum LB1]GAM17966.1 hypothetical protein SAMD00019534_011410 [Acytostelium subglobosum LB1]|eukprot:XP_012758562.1 hypothetical protein SAMD00019534_011410 [Acytostelium subglobosum LB1]
MSQYSFGIRTPLELYTHLNEIGFNLTEEDIIKPQPDTMRRIYERFLTESTDYNREESAQIKFQGMNLLTNPDMHDESVSEVNFVRSLIRFMRNIGAADFGTRDIYRPEYPRTRKALSAVINFAIFREMRVNRHMELARRHEDLAIEASRTREESEDLHNQLEILRDKREDIDRQTFDLQQDLDQLNFKLHTVNKEQAEMARGNTELKTIDDELNHKIEDHIFSISTINQDISRMEAMVVKSPDRVKRMIEDMESSLKNERDQVIKVDEEIKKIQFKLNKVEKIAGDMQKTEALGEKSKVEHHKYKKVRQECKELQKKIANQQKALKDLEGVIARLDKNIDHSNDTMASNRQRFNKNKEDLNITMQEVENENKGLRQEEQENNAQGEEIERKIDEVQLLLEEEVHNSEEVRSLLYSKYQTLVSAILSFHQQLEDTMVSPPEKMSD